MKTPDPYMPVEAFVPPIFGELIPRASNLAAVRDREWSNEERAASAHLSCRFFGAIVHATDADDKECNMRDLLTNLMHYCDIARYDFADNLRIASEAFEDEQREDVGRDPSPYEKELVGRSAPRWAWDAIDEILALPGWHKKTKKATTAMIDACEDG